MRFESKYNFHIIIFIMLLGISFIVSMRYLYIDNSK